MKQSGGCSPISKCVNVTSAEFVPFNGYAPCGASTDIYDLLSDDKSRVFSTAHNVYSYSITFVITYKSNIRPSAYLIASRENPSGCYWRYPKKFRFLGSKDNGQTWRELDYHDGNELYVKSTLFSFPVTKNFGSYFTYKFIVDETDRTSNTLAAISLFDIEGDFIKEKIETCTNIKWLTFFLHLSIFLLIK
jgi:hypothetical protein